MLAADNLIDDVVEIVLDPSFERPQILRYLNNGVLAVADTLLLPDLADGNDTVQTVVGQNNVDLPTDFHKQITMAQVDDCHVVVYHSLSLMVQRIGVLAIDVGSVAGITRSGKRLYYQRVPADATDMDLMYYRLPVDMTDTDDEYPDGVSNCQSFENAIKAYACWRIFEIMERGIEGQKVNTGYYKSMFDQYLLETDHYCRKTTGAQVELPLSGYPGDNIF